MFGNGYQLGSYLSRYQVYLALREGIALELVCSGTWLILRKVSRIRKVKMYSKTSFLYRDYITSRSRHRGDI